MSSVLSAGILMFRQFAEVGSTVPTGDAKIEVLIGHMGGPFWARKDQGAWSIPKGEVDTGENPFNTARREFEEELGHPAPVAGYVDLGRFEQSRRKEIHVWGVEGNLDATTCRSNTFELEWPPHSGQFQHFPEIDRVAWLVAAIAATKVVRGQRQVIARLVDLLDGFSAPDPA